MAYGSRFYRKNSEWKELGSRAVLGWLFRQLGGPVESMVDFGCGAGIWPQAAKGLGVSKVLGLDGQWIGSDAVRLNAQEFRRVDLGREIDLDQNYELSVSLEVAEHLSPESASIHVRNLTTAAPLVVFSAAVPGQGGRHHVNEQWPSYWSRHFAAHGYRCLDVFRPHFWEEPDVPYWYRQNMLLFANDRRIADSGWLTEQATLQPEQPLNLIHPELWQRKAHAELRERITAMEHAVTSWFRQ